MDDSIESDCAPVLNKSVAIHVGRGDVPEIPIDRFWDLAPAGALQSVVWTISVHTIARDAPPYHHRSIPNGSVELICKVGASPVVVGPRTQALSSILEPGAVVVGARLHPEAAARVLGLPPTELVERTLPAEAIWGQAGARLGERIAEARTAAAAVAVLEAHIAARLQSAREPDSVVAELVRRMLSASGESVHTLRSSLPISERQLRRRFHDVTGFAPKTLQRLLRFQRFLAAVQHEHARGHGPGNLARLAALAGYADQPHLTRECVRLAGVSPRRFVAETRRHCGPTHDHAAAFRPLRACP